MAAKHCGFQVMLPVLAALLLGACSTQPPDAVRVTVGTGETAQLKARDYAALYAPYAMMATVAYTDPIDLNGKQCPDTGKLSHPRVGDSPRDAADRIAIRDWILTLNRHGWHCDSGMVGGKDCPPKYGPGCKPVGGLEFHVWRRQSGRVCTEVAIAFRGTDKNETGDWVSNFRWLYRLAPKFDQYAQVQTLIEPLVHQLKRECGANAMIVSAGHSLGGGLAQQAAYAAGEKSISYVYAFDPSPVTGFFDVSALVRDKSINGLGVDRAYEAGEILVLPRLIIENIFPPLGCNPRVRSVRFNLLTGLPFTQHRIADLTSELAKTGRGGNPRKVLDYAAAKDCTPSLMGIAPPA